MRFSSFGSVILLLLLSSGCTSNLQVTEYMDEISMLENKVANANDNIEELKLELEKKDNNYKALMKENSRLSDEIIGLKNAEEEQGESYFERWNYEINFINGDQNSMHLTYFVNESEEEVQVVNIIGNNFSRAGESYKSEQTKIKGFGEGEYVKFIIFGDVYNLGLYSLAYEGSGLDYEDAERILIESLGDVSDIEVMVETTLPEGLPSEVVRWNDVHGNTYEEYLSYDGLGASGKLIVSCKGAE